MNLTETRHQFDSQDIASYYIFFSSVETCFPDYSLISQTEDRTWTQNWRVNNFVKTPQNSFKMKHLKLQKPCSLVTIFFFLLNNPHSYHIECLLESIYFYTNVIKMIAEILYMCHGVIRLNCIFKCETVIPPEPIWGSTCVPKEVAILQLCTVNIPQIYCNDTIIVSEYCNPVSSKGLNSQSSFPESYYKLIVEHNVA